MTNYTAIKIAKDWNLARSRHTNAGDDDTVGNLSFREEPSKDKKDFYSSTEEWKEKE